VTRAGGGTGGVVSNPAGIDCGADCSEAYVSGSVVELTATAAGGSVFAGWSGAAPAPHRAPSRSPAPPPSTPGSLSYTVGDPQRQRRRARHRDLEPGRHQLRRRLQEAYLRPGVT
jgi:hypothetical protein